MTHEAVFVAEGVDAVVSIVRDVGFPMFVALFVLLRLERRILEVVSEVSKLRQDMAGCRVMAGKGGA